MFNPTGGRIWIADGVRGVMIGNDQQIFFHDPIGLIGLELLQG
jgi:hypothetical protein